MRQISRKTPDLEVLPSFIEFLSSRSDDAEAQTLVEEMKRLLEMRTAERSTDAAAATGGSSPPLTSSTASASSIAGLSASGIAQDDAAPGGPSQQPPGTADASPASAGKINSAASPSRPAASPDKAQVSGQDHKPAPPCKDVDDLIGWLLANNKTRRTAGAQPSSRQEGWHRYVGMPEFFLLLHYAARRGAADAIRKLLGFDIESVYAVRSRACSHE